MKQSHGPAVWDPFFKVSFTYICNETGPYRLSWGTLPLPWLNGVIKSVFLERSQRELGSLSHFIQRGRQSCPRGVILFHTERLMSFKHTIVSSNPTVLPCCNAIHSVAASVSVSLSLASSLFALSQWLACCYMDHQHAALVHNNWEGDIHESWDNTRTSVRRDSLWLCLVPWWNNKSNR